MKKMIFFFACMVCMLCVSAQLKVKAKCNEFYVDVLDGTVNDVRPDYTMGQVKDKLPCFSSSDAEGDATAKCGGTVFYKDRDVYFYTDRDYIEIREKFKGKLSMPLLGATRKMTVKLLGQPLLKDDTWDAFRSAYGIIMLVYNSAGKVSIVRLSTKTADTIKLCE